ncbi:energy transducer TonB family protein [Frateuria aurantia]
MLGGTVLATSRLSGLTVQGPSLAQQMEAIGGRAPLPESRHTGWLASRREPPRGHATGAARHHQPPPASWPTPSHLPPVMEASTPASVGSAEPSRYLVPLRIPPETSRYLAMRVHHYGRVVLGVRLDASGGVGGLWLQQPSGDAVLDAYALQRVRGWRFAPPPPDDDTGLLALRFESSRR